MDEVCNKNKEPGTLVTKIMRYESDQMSEDEEIGFFQELIDSGLAWSLQGHYGRVAASLIEQELCKKKEE